MKGHGATQAFQVPKPVEVATARGPIQCAVVGEGPAIVGLHGGMGGYDQSWLLAKAVAGDLQGYRIVAVSRPGYLGTALDLGRTPSEQADLVAALLAALDIPDAAIVAVSAGGPCALQFASLYPERCRSLILVSACTGPLETPQEILQRMRLMETLAQIPCLATMLRWRTARNPDQSARRSIREPELRAKTLLHPEAGVLLRTLQSSVFEHMRDRLPGTINDIGQFATLPQLPTLSITAPMLIVHGDADTVVPFDHAKAVGRQAAHAELLAIPRGEHVSLFTHLDLVRAKADRFLKASANPDGQAK